MYCHRESGTSWILHLSLYKLLTTFPFIWVVEKHTSCVVGIIWPRKPNRIVLRPQFLSNQTLQSPFSSNTNWMSCLLRMAGFIFHSLSPRWNPERKADRGSKRVNAITRTPQQRRPGVHLLEEDSNEMAGFWWRWGGAAIDLLCEQPLAALWCTRRHTPQWSECDRGASYARLPIYGWSRSCWARFEVLYKVPPTPFSMS